MMKFKAHGKHGGEPGVIVGLGISDGNIERLKAQLPIVVDLHQMGIVTAEVRFIQIFYGGTDAQMNELAKQMVAANPDAGVSEQKRAHEG